MQGPEMNDIAAQTPPSTFSSRAVVSSIFASVYWPLPR
jgi:hypothetical protein